jgi:hypothetical protein
MGLATGIVRSIPYGEQESARRAWSAVGGEWRLVRIRYPDHVPPQWGRSPGPAIALGLLVAGFFGFLLVGTVQVVWPVLDDLPVEGTWLRTVLLAVAAVLAALALRGLLILALGLSDVGQGRTVEGRVVRLRTRKDGEGNTVNHAVAVDDGTSDEIRAWKIRVLPAGVRQGTWVRAVVTPRLGFVRSLVATRAAAEEAAAQESSRS